MRTHADPLAKYRKKEEQLAAEVIDLAELLLEERRVKCMVQGHLEMDITRDHCAYCFQHNDYETKALRELYGTQPPEPNPIMRHRLATRIEELKFTDYQHAIKELAKTLE